MVETGYMIHHQLDLRSERGSAYVDDKQIVGYRTLVSDKRNILRSLITHRLRKIRPGKRQS